jgi:D-alanyl-D-alanine carboxypeptidase (penicillin-binding protein 5/6)
MTSNHFMNSTGLPHPEHYSALTIWRCWPTSSSADQGTLLASMPRKDFLWNNIKQGNRNLLLWRDKGG